MNRMDETTDMNRSSEVLRARHRRVLRWSLAAAVLIHVAVFVAWPQFEPEPGIDLESELGPPPESPRVLAVVFGPPLLTAPDGATWQEPPDRVLETVTLIDLPAECSETTGEVRYGVEGSVRLRVNGGGHAAVLDLAEGTGTACGDRLIKSVAGDLWYHWLPNDQFPAPLDLVQPVSLVEK